MMPSVSYKCIKFRQSDEPLPISLMQSSNCNVFNFGCILCVHG